MTVRLAMSAKKAPTDAPDSRLDFRNGFVRNADNTLRTGVTAPVAAGQQLVTATSDTAPMTVWVMPCDLVGARDGGVVQLCNDGPIKVNVAAAPASGQRLDVVYIMQHDSSSGVTTPDLDDLAGAFVATGQAVPSGQPAKPAIPAAAVELATIYVPAGVTSTTGVGIVITQTFQYTAAAGGEVPFPTSAGLLGWSNPQDGQRAYALDAAQHYWRGGGSWLTVDRSGLIPILPTSSSGVVITGNRIDFTAVSALMLNGLFTSRFRNYLVKWRITARSAASGNGNNVENFQLAAGGVANASTYSWRRVVSNASGVSTVAGSAKASWDSFAADATLYTAKQMDVFNPAVADRTLVLGKGLETDAAGAVSLLEYTGVHGVLSAFDGLALSVVLGTVTGSIWVYGYNE